MNQKMARNAVIASMTTSALLAIIGVFVLTDAGQLLGISKATVVLYFQNHLNIMGLSAALFVAAIYLNRRLQLLRPWMMAVFGVFLLGCFIVTKYMVPYIMFPAQQRSAVYKSISDAEGYLQPADIVYVIHHNGVARAFAKKTIWQSHIFGGDFGGDEVVMTYCVLTNLPVPYINDLEGEPMDLKVLAQTNNNLLLWDTNSGEIIQQITNTCELSGRQLEALPVIEMTWKSYQELFPNGEVLYNQFTTPIERTLDVLMPLDEAHSGENWMFKTVDLDDRRLPSKEQVIGIKDGSDSVAYTREYLRRVGIVNTRVGNKSVAIAHIAEHDIFVAFDRMKDGEEIEVTEVDVFGNSKEHGKLAPVFIYNGPMWAVWVHYHPETELLQ
jgi:hypothetical protein